MDQVPVSAVFGFTLSNPDDPPKADDTGADPALVRAGEGKAEPLSAAARSGTEKMVVGYDKGAAHSAAVTKRAATATFNPRKGSVATELELAHAKSTGHHHLSARRRASNSHATEVVAPLVAIGPRNRGRAPRPLTTQQRQNNGDDGNVQLAFSAPRVESGLMKMSL